jgi:hypothetical protein
MIDAPGRSSGLGTFVEKVLYNWKFLAIYKEQCNEN